MENIDKYINIPYVFAGYDYNGADCVGLLRLFYSEHNWMEMYDGEFTKDWYKKEPYRMVKWFLRNMNKVRNIDDLQFGDVVYFNINGEGHVGIYYKYGKILTTFPDDSKQWDGTYMPHNSFLCHRQLWEKAYKCGFRRR